jgi:hypothetical protein
MATRARVTLTVLLKTRLDDAPVPHKFTAWTQFVFAVGGPPRT